MVRNLIFLAVLLLTAAASMPTAWANADEDAVTQTAASFVEAFHRGDARAAAALWTPEGDYVDQTGRVYHGRKAIEQCFTEFFSENKGLKLRIEVNSLKFPAKDVAVEDGTTLVSPPDGALPSRARYTNVLVKRDGKWLLAACRESVFTPPSRYEVLRPLEWAIGDWVDETPSGEVGRLSFRWSSNENYIVSTHWATVKDLPIAHGSQRIAWDPASGKIRSWSFEDDGGYSEAWWTVEGGKWYIRSTSVMENGTKVTATNIVTRLDPNTITWQATERKQNGQPLPDIPPIKMKRVK